jgi:hypothetical protein
MFAGLAIAVLVDRLSGGLSWPGWLALILLPVCVVLAQRGLAAGRAAVRRFDDTGKAS